MATETKFKVVEKDIEKETGYLFADEFESKEEAMELVEERKEELSEEYYFVFPVEVGKSEM